LRGDGHAAGQAIIFAMMKRANLTPVSFLLRICGAGLAIAIAFAASAQAQGAPKKSAAAPTTAASGPPNALQGFSQNRDKPIQIDAARLEVHDKDKIATFFGDAKADVKVVQGDVTMRSQVLIVFYDQDNPNPGAGKSAKAAAPGPGGSSQIKRLVAKGKVIVTQKDQTVTGDNGVFDMKSNTVTMSGGVVMTQNDNVLRGDKLVVDMSTGVSRVETPGGRVNALIKNNNSSSGSGAATPGSPKDAGKSSNPLGVGGLR
jgi:lipopolysaccharide export system protein LptA